MRASKTIRMRNETCAKARRRQNTCLQSMEEGAKQPREKWLERGGRRRT